jgi:hypothetical protein
MATFIKVILCPKPELVETALSRTTGSCKTVSSNNMLRRLILLFPFIFAISTSLKSQALLNIYEETSYPYDENTKEAKEQFTWTINGTTLKYKTGSYKIKVNGQNSFDTIILQTTSLRTDPNIAFYDKDKKIDKLKIKKAKKHLDTIATTIVCKLKDLHNYKLGQVFPNHFEIYSLDTFETRKDIVFKVTNKKKNDTLYCYIGYKEYQILSDTTINFFESNEKMERSFLANILLTKTKRKYVCYEGKPSKGIFELNFQFLNAEKIEVEFNCESGEYYLKLLE